jgi:hypothetical protein
MSNMCVFACVRLRIAVLCQIRVVPLVTSRSRAHKIQHVYVFVFACVCPSDCSAVSN